MSEGSWAKPSSARRQCICGVVAAIHAVLLLSFRPQSAPVPGQSTGGNLVFLVPPWGKTINSAGSKKPTQDISKKKPLATRLPDRRADEVVAPDESLTIEKTPEVDANWAAGQPVNPEPVTDVRTLSLALAGKADAQVRQGKPVTLDPVDTPFRRMQSGMAQAARGGGNSTTTAVSASGETITIVTRNGKSHCYVPVSTSVAPSAVFDNRGGGRSTKIQCPKELR